MVERRYKAFISYSHTDEKWASWLQRALETYRVPARLVAGRDLPRRLSPIFRDRADLSSAINLSDSLVEALTASEAMLVVCSPAAVRSKWVNEEIRRFRGQQREAQIFCMIVDGDPGAKSSDQACFPPALFEAAGAEVVEPLAADARDFADGKRLAKLKLVAALLGVRLDELRQRDLRRRRRWQAMGALAIALAIALGAITVLSLISERKERENAEQMAAFVVELGEDLQSDVDLDTLSRISARAMGYLQELNPRNLTPETSIKVGLALRQLGHVNLGQAKLPESLAAYRQSLDMLMELGEKYPERQDVMFETAQAEFYVGNYHYEQGEIQLAREPWQRYLAISQKLREADPSDRRWMLEVSYGTMNLLLLRLNSGVPADESLLEAVNEAVELARQTLQAWPDSSEVISHYSNMLAWAADADQLACHLDAEIGYRRETLEMAIKASRGNPSSNDLRERLAYAHSGMAVVNADLGKTEEAERNLHTTLEILQELLAKDPTNRMLAAEITASKRLLASLLMNTHRLELAIPLMQDVGANFEPLLPIAELTELEIVGYSRFMLDFTVMNIRLGDQEQARQALAHSSEIAAHFLAEGGLGREVKSQLALLRFLGFELNGRDPSLELPGLATAEPESLSEFRSCSDADLSARLAIVKGDREGAVQQANYLQARNYRNPGFMLFCKKYELCAE